MFNVAAWGFNACQYIWGEQSAESAEEKIVYQLDDLEVKVDLNPIGGYRGKVGTLIISHVKHKVFTQWKEDDLKALAQLEQKILFIQEKAQIENALIFGRQDGDDNFKLSIVPYPKCDWIEKIQGFIHVIFGCPSLNENEVKAIADFYIEQFAEEGDISESAGEKREGKPDAFCRDAVIEEQRIAELSFDDETYYLLHDKWPKGRTVLDPHLLIIPTGDSGHCDGSQVSQDKRFHMLQTAQKVMRILLDEEHFSTLLFREFNGEKLQSVLHKHFHVIGVEHFPDTFLEKILAMMRQLYATALPDLKGRIEHYQKYDWSVERS